MCDLARRDKVYYARRGQIEKYVLAMARICEDVIIIDQKILLSYFFEEYYRFPSLFVGVRFSKIFDCE